MNLQQVIDLVGLNRNTYNTIERRTGLGFMKLDVGTGRDRYHYPHAVALACLLEFLKNGTESASAARALTDRVTDLFPYIRRAVAEIHDASHAGGGVSPCWITISFFADGPSGFAFGAENSDSLRNDAVSKHSVNVLAVLKSLVATEASLEINAVNKSGALAA